MSTDRRDWAPLHPAIHLAPRRGWMNDPNGLCFVDGVWHAFYQYDADTDVHGVMHWGHSTSDDLVRWTEQQVALSPDHHGVIFSGSAVVDVDNSAGFGAGALVAIFTQHLPTAQRQSLAYSVDHGATWQMYPGNPVLESDEPDFRDPKVRRQFRDGRPEWVMTLAVGRRVDFYRSADLRHWTQSGTFDDSIPAEGVWECPDLLAIDAADGTQHWFLTVGVIAGGPQGHSGTFIVPGDFDGGTFVATGPATLLDYGPDYYAAQSFWGAPNDACVQMGWLGSWRYAQTHPSRGRRGVQSIPRRLEAINHDSVTSSGALVRATPYPDLAGLATPLAATSWRSEPDRALYIAAAGDVEITVGDGTERAASVRITGAEVVLERFGERVDQYTQTYRAPIRGSGRHQIVIDHGTLEIFADDGATSMSALVFAGADWRVDFDGDGTLSVI